MTIEEIRELIELVNQTGVSELEVERGDNRVRICARSSVATQYVMSPQMAAPLASAPPAAALPKAEGAGKRPEGLHLVKSPIVGTFYESTSPDLPPFVRIGEHVTVGKVLCIIESMKLMNEIEADASGIVETRVVQNGQPVEYGEALFGIRPV